MRPDASAEVIVGILSAYQRSAVLKAAIELDVFSAIGEGAADPQALSARCRVSERGIRALANYLVVLGLLRKRDDTYLLTRESAAFLDKASDQYIGRVGAFAMHPHLIECFREAATAVRHGGRPEPTGSLGEDHPAWLDYAETMGDVMAPVAMAVADVLEADSGERLKILDVGAGHGMFGITIARRNPNATVVATDWPGVLRIAAQNAGRAGISDRFHLLPGDLRTMEFSHDFDLAILANVLHQFDPDVCRSLLRRIRHSLTASGRVVTVEWVPNDDRISPPAAAMFDMTMLATTPVGRTYTFNEFEVLFRGAGFVRSTMCSLPASHQRAIVSYLR